MILKKIEMTKKQLNLTDTDWWRGAIIYQIYPRSYQDSNGDGIGDLQGITTRLPYIASLGVDAIWISPFFPSPMKDFGYDVSDYCDVDAMFGSLQDFDQLIDQAHQLEIRVMIDLVLSHTSDLHSWFTESRQSQENPKANWYVWADAQADGTPPNNWLSVFGGSAWQWDSRRCQYYLHNFLKEQPDLNFHEPQVQEALLDVIRFWLKRGVDGFRLDTINLYVHDAQLRDNPALPPDQRDNSTAPLVNPFSYQDHIYNRNQPENLEFLQKMRQVMNPYNAAAVGEVGDIRGLQIIGQYTAGDCLMHMCYAFNMLAPTRLTASRVVEVIQETAKQIPDGWICWAFSNHDVQRHRSRWQLNDEATRCYATLLMCLHSSVCIYQGEELGLTEAELNFEDLQDPYGIEFYPEFQGRDGCRTPMVWENTKQRSADFSSTSPWLPVPDEHQALAVSEQENNPHSLLQHYRKMICLRHQNSALMKGDLLGITHQGDVLSFIRKNDQQTLFCIFNLGETSVTLSSPDGQWKPMIEDTGTYCSETIHLQSWGALILEHL